MADVQPLRTLRYDLAAVGSLDAVAAPPYDVIDPPLRAQLAAKSPFNVVEVDLPEENGGDPYLHAQTTMEAWLQEGIVRRERDPAMWAMTQDYTGPDGRAHTRHGFFCRVRVEDYGPGRIRPHERTQPGPKEDRLRPTRAPRATLSPIFSLFPDPEQQAWRTVESVTQTEPYATVTDGDGTVNRLWRVAEPLTIAHVQDALRDRELLIADGHHRYETARVYAQEVGGEGEHRYVLMFLCSLQDSGLTLLPTHTPLKGLDDDKRAALRTAIEAPFDVSEIASEELEPPDGDGPLEMGYIDSFFKRGFRLTLKDQAIADRALDGEPEPYRRPDTAILEALILKGPLGLTDDDIDHMRGLGYARNDAEALELVLSGAYDAAFFLRPTPVAQVREIAATGVNMPPKTTYFFPKIPTGLVFNPLL